MISVFLPYFVHHKVEFHLSQFWDGLFFSLGQVWYKKDHQLFFQNRRYPGCLCHNWLKRTPEIVVVGCFPLSLTCFESCRHQFHSLLCFIEEFIPDVGISEETCNNGFSKQNRGSVFRQSVSVAWLFGRTWAMFGGVLGTPLQFLAVVLQQLAHGCFNKGT